MFGFSPGELVNLCPDDRLIVVQMISAMLRRSGGDVLCLRRIARLCLTTMHRVVPACWTCSKVSGSTMYRGASMQDDASNT